MEPDTTVTKIDSKHSPRGPEGEKYLASGVRVSMRLWEAASEAAPSGECVGR
jgi:hypothetical protein